ILARSVAPGDRRSARPAPGNHQVTPPLRDAGHAIDTRSGSGWRGRMMTDQRSEQRLRDWFISGPAIEEPSRIHDFLAALPVAHPRDEPAPRPATRRRFAFIAATVAIAVTAAAVAVVGSRLLATSP